MKERVLIVDDHASFRSSARFLLEAEGYQVVGEAEDGRSGIAEAEKLEPEVVLLQAARGRGARGRSRRLSNHSI